MSTMHKSTTHTASRHDQGESPLFPIKGNPATLNIVSPSQAMHGNPQKHYQDGTKSPFRSTSSRGAEDLSPAQMIYAYQQSVLQQSSHASPSHVPVHFDGGYMHPNMDQMLAERNNSTSPSSQQPSKQPKNNGTNRSPLLPSKTAERVNLKTTVHTHPTHAMMNNGNMMYPGGYSGAEMHPAENVQYMLLDMNHMQSYNPMMYSPPMHSTGQMEAPPHSMVPNMMGLTQAQAQQMFLQEPPAAGHMYLHHHAPVRNLGLFHSFFPHGMSDSHAGSHMPMPPHAMGRQYYFGTPSPMPRASGDPNNGNNMSSTSSMANAMSLGGSFRGSSTPQSQPQPQHEPRYEPMYMRDDRAWSNDAHQMAWDQAQGRSMHMNHEDGGLLLPSQITGQPTPKSGAGQVFSDIDRSDERHFEEIAATNASATQTKGAGSVTRSEKQGQGLVFVANIIKSKSEDADANTNTATQAIIDDAPTYESNTSSAIEAVEVKPAVSSQEDSQASPRVVQWVRRKQPKGLKSKLCRFYLDGGRDPDACPYKFRCFFAHGESEIVVYDQKSSEENTILNSSNKKSNERGKNTPSPSNAAVANARTSKKKGQGKVSNGFDGGSGTFDMKPRRNDDDDYDGPPKDSMEPLKLNRVALNSNHSMFNPSLTIASNIHMRLALAEEASANLLSEAAAGELSRHLSAITGATNGLRFTSTILSMIRLAFSPSKPDAEHSLVEKLSHRSSISALKEFAITGSGGNRSGETNAASSSTTISTTSPLSLGAISSQHSMGAATSPPMLADNEKTGSGTSANDATASGSNSWKRRLTIDLGMVLDPSKDTADIASTMADPLKDFTLELSNHSTASQLYISPEGVPPRVGRLGSLSSASGELATPEAAMHPEGHVGACAEHGYRYYTPRTNPNHVSSTTSTAQLPPLEVIKIKLNPNAPISLSPLRLVSSSSELHSSFTTSHWATQGHQGVHQSLSPLARSYRGGDRGDMTPTTPATAQSPANGSRRQRLHRASSTQTSLRSMDSVESVHMDSNPDGIAASERLGSDRRKATAVVTRDKGIVEDKTLDREVMQDALEQTAASKMPRCEEDGILLRSARVDAGGTVSFMDIFGKEGLFISSSEGSDRAILSAAWSASSWLQPHYGNSVIVLDTSPDHRGVVDGNPFSGTLFAASGQTKEGTEETGAAADISRISSGLSSQDNSAMSSDMGQGALARNRAASTTVPEACVCFQCQLVGAEDDASASDAQLAAKTPACIEWLRRNRTLGLMTPRLTEAGKERKSFSEFGVYSQPPLTSADSTETKVQASSNRQEHATNHDAPQRDKPIEPPSDLDPLPKVDIRLPGDVAEETDSNGVVTPTVSPTACLHLSPIAPLSPCTPCTSFMSHTPYSPGVSGTASAFVTPMSTPAHTPKQARVQANTPTASRGLFLGTTAAPVYTALSHSFKGRLSRMALSNDALNQSLDRSFQGMPEIEEDWSSSAETPSTNASTARSSADSPALSVKRVETSNSPLQLKPHVMLSDPELHSARSGAQEALDALTSSRTTRSGETAVYPRVNMAGSFTRLTIRNFLTQHSKALQACGSEGENTSEQGEHTPISVQIYVTDAEKQVLYSARNTRGNDSEIAENVALNDTITCMDLGRFHEYVEVLYASGTPPASGRLIQSLSHAQLAQLLEGSSSPMGSSDLMHSGKHTHMHAHVYTTPGSETAEHRTRMSHTEQGSPPQFSGTAEAMRACMCEVGIKVWQERMQAKAKVGAGRSQWDDAGGKDDAQQQAHASIVDSSVLNATGGYGKDVTSEMGGEVDEDSSAANKELENTKSRGALSYLQRLNDSMQLPTYCSNCRLPLPPSDTAMPSPLQYLLSFDPQSMPYLATPPGGHDTGTQQVHSSLLRLFTANSVLSSSKSTIFGAMSELSNGMGCSNDAHAGQHSEKRGSNTDDYLGNISSYLQEVSKRWKNAENFTVLDMLRFRIAGLLQTFSALSTKYSDCTARELENSMELLNRSMQSSGRTDRNGDIGNGIKIATLANDSDTPLSPIGNSPVMSWRESFSSNFKSRALDACKEILVNLQFAMNALGNALGIASFSKSHRFDPQETQNLIDLGSSLLEYIPSAIEKTFGSSLGQLLPEIGDQARKSAAAANASASAENKSASRQLRGNSLDLTLSHRSYDLEGGSSDAHQFASELGMPSTNVYKHVAHPSLPASTSSGMSSVPTKSSSNGDALVESGHAATSNTDDTKAPPDFLSYSFGMNCMQNLLTGGSKSPTTTATAASTNSTTVTSTTATIATTTTLAGNPMKSSSPLLSAFKHPAFTPSSMPNSHFSHPASPHANSRDVRHFAYTVPNTAPNTSPSLTSTPSSAPAARSDGRRTKPASKKLCHQWVQTGGKFCSRGSACEFSHEPIVITDIGPIKLSSYKRLRASKNLASKATS